MRFDELCLHERDRQFLASFAKTAGAGLLLIADRGFGKETIANVLAGHIVSGRAYDIKSIKASGTPSITIEQIRELKQFFILKPNASNEPRVAVIHSAELMTIEAQNALLKLLEEPPEHCYMILTTQQPSLLLTTIVSRLQAHTLTTPLPDDIYMHLKRRGLNPESSKIANGLPGLAISIASGESDELVDQVQKAKELLGADMLTRLKLIDALTKDKQQLNLFLQALKIVATGALTATSESGKQTKRWEQLTRAVLQAQKRIESNVSPKLTLTHLMLSL
jgi:DNA polymerase III subunit delta'